MWVVSGPSLGFDQDILGRGGWKYKINAPPSEMPARPRFAVDKTEFRANMRK